MIDLNDLRLFERVAALRSFAAASRELDVPRSSVSRGLQRLEAELGVRLLQRTGVILSAKHHAHHHTAPYTRNYCITSGWLNPLFEHFRVFTRLERLITHVTGVEPRHDPLSDQLAAEVLRRLPAHAPLDAPLETTVDPVPVATEGARLAPRHP